MIPAPLPRSTPAAQGVAAAGLLAFVDAVEAAGLGLHSLMLLRHGQVVVEGWWAPYAASAPHMLFSLSKSFTSTAIGLAVAEGRLATDDPVVGFFPEQAPSRVSANLAALQVRHLLSMSTGHAQDTTEAMTKATDGDWVRAFLAQPVDHTPGAPFVYNSGATYMLSALVQLLTGSTVLDYLTPRLLTPLGITGATWEVCPRGINTGGWGLSIKTEDIARFGQLYLQQGVWQGQQLIPAAWVDAATARQVTNGSNPESDWEQGYGYQFWRCRHGAYRGDGAFGQYCVVLPSEDAVLAITAGIDLEDMQAVLDLVWEHLLPALGTNSLAGDAGALAALQQKLAALALPVVSGAPTSPLQATVTGKTYRFDTNTQDAKSIAFDFSTKGCTITWQRESTKHQLVCGYGAWRTGISSFDARTETPVPVAVSGAWTADDTYTVYLCYTQAPFCPTLTCRFAGDTMKVDYVANVDFGPKARPTLVGRA